MAWDINARGMIDLTPLVHWETGVIAGTGCGIRLVLARPEDQPGTGSLVVQTVMTDGQAEELIGHLQRMVHDIRTPPLTAPH